LLIVAIAVSTAIGPFIGQNLGANLYERIKRAIHISFNLSIVFYTLLALIMIPLSIPLIQVFTNDAQIIETAKKYLYIVPASYGFIAVTIIGTSVFNVLKRAYVGNLMMVLRMFMIFIPLALILSKQFGLTGIFTAALVSNIIAGLIFWISAYKLFKKQEEF
jgi:Na+-driven multidrug efflux pump